MKRVRRLLAGVRSAGDAGVTDSYVRLFHSYGSELVSRTGMKHVWRRRHSSMKSPGRTLSLGRINDSLCRVLTAML